LRIGLYLNPLYSTRGGCTIWTAMRTKKPVFVFFRLNPRYKWVTLIHLTPVWSPAESQDCFCNTYFFVGSLLRFLCQTLEPAVVFLCLKKFWFLIKTLECGLFVNSKESYKFFAK
jgi:hypothetical protein